MSADEASEGPRLRVYQLSRQFGPRQPKLTQSTPPPTASPKLPKVLLQVQKKATSVSSDFLIDTSGTAVDNVEVDHGMPSSAEAVDYSSVKADACPHSEDTAPRAPVVNVQLIDQDHYIGLDQLQEQVRRIALRRGFTLNLMVIGK